MKFIANRKRGRSFALVSLAALLLVSCGTATHEWLEAPGWSRARWVAETESAYPVLPALDADGNRYLATAHIRENVPIIEVIALNPRLETPWQTEIPLERLRRAEKPSLILTARGLEVFWLLEDSLFSAVLDTDGSLLSQPARLSGSNFVAHYDVNVNHAGERVLFFSGDRLRPGLYAVAPSGDIISLDREGQRPRAKIDAGGGLHVVWLQNKSGEFEYDFYYAHYPDAAVSPDHEQLLYTAILAITSGLRGPELGLDENDGYIFWSEETRTGTAAGQVGAFYVSFPLGAEEGSPEISAKTSVTFPNGYGLNYREAESGEVLKAGPRAFPQDQFTRLFSSVTEMNANPLPGDEVALALRARLPYLRNKMAAQVGLVFLDGRQATSYQLLSFTPGITQQPSIRADENGYLHATWLEQTTGGEYRLYYATTEPVGRAALDELTSEDGLRISGDALFGLMSGVILIPFPIFWGLGPVILTFLTGPLRRENEPFTAPATLLTVVLGLAIYWAIKLFSLPGILSYVPFSAWVPTLPQAWFDPLRIGVPILISLIGLFAAYRGTYGRENNTPLFFFLLFALVDGMISIAIYGVIFFGAI